MEDNTIYATISRIISGYHIFNYKNKKLKVKYPDIDLRYEAELLALEESKKHRFETWIRSENMLSFLIGQGLWNKESEDYLKECDTLIENTKIDIFRNFRNPSALKNFRKKLERYNSTYNKLYKKRHDYDYLTLEGYCEIVKSNFLLEHSIYDENNSLYLKDNVEAFDEISLIVAKTVIPMPLFRKVARSSIWHSYWYSKKAGNILSAPITQWTDEQRFLVSTSRMYDNAREHPESPDDDVFEDDDAFDGWSAFERKKEEKERSQKRAEKMLPGKLKDAQEIFVVAHNQHEAKDIDNLNDQSNTMIIKERNAFIQKYGKVDAINLPDAKRDLIINSNQKHKK